MITKTVKSIFGNVEIIPQSDKEVLVSPIEMIFVNGVRIRARVYFQKNDDGQWESVNSHSSFSRYTILDPNWKKGVSTAARKKIISEFVNVIMELVNDDPDIFRRAEIENLTKEITRIKANLKDKNREIADLEQELVDATIGKYALKQLENNLVKEN